MPKEEKSAKATKDTKAEAEKPVASEDQSSGIPKPKTPEEIQANAIYGLKLHESCLSNSGHRVTRVPGGWIYLTMDSMANSAESVFVPFSDEFKG